MPALRLKTCRLLSGNVRKRELTIIQRRILRRLRRTRRSIKRKIYPRENLNSYIQSQTTRKLSPRVQKIKLNCKNIKASIMVSIYFLLLKKSFRFLLSFCYIRYLLSYSYFEVILSKIFYFWDAEGPAFGNQMVPSDGSPGSESGARRAFSRFFKKVFGCFMENKKTEDKTTSIRPEDLIQVEVDPTDTQNQLRQKGAVILSSYYSRANIVRENSTWLDIVQHLAFERSGRTDVTREDLVWVIQALKDPANTGRELYLKANRFLLLDDSRYNRPPRY